MTTRPPDNSQPAHRQRQRLPHPSTPLADKLTRPLAIGGRTIPCRLVLAPLSKIGHLAFRNIVTRHGGFGLLFSGMCAATRVARRGKGSGDYRHGGHEKANLVSQLLGSDPAAIAAAAHRVESAGMFGVDINLGCSVKAICRNNCGAALLGNPGRATAIVKAVRRSVAFPVFVKFRTGWSDDIQAAVDLARRFEDAGADALTFHPRVAPDRRSRQPKWAYITKVKSAVSIPVFGNGNVFDRADCLKMLRTTGCDGVALGRLAIARPWIFAEWTHGARPAATVYRDTALKMIENLAQIFDPQTALRRFNRFAAYFSANFQFGHTFFSRICRAGTLAEATEAVNRFFDTSPAIVNRPHFEALGR